MAVVNPYLGFNGTCGPAFDFYKSVFGGDFAMKMLFKDAPSSEHTTAAEAGLIMHVALPIGTSVLMGSDRPASMGQGTQGDHFTLSIGAASKAEADKLYNGLSAGGKITMPIGMTFWGSYFGMFIDKFGIQWMVGFDEKRPG